jgi:uncharacterized protein with FMN-binding domain
MKKSIVVILAVAIIGGLGIYARGHKTQAGGSTAPETAAPASIGQPAAQAGMYKNGTFIGDTEDTIYGPVQVAAVISNGRISDIKFLRMPNSEGHTREVTAFSKQPLKNSAISKQSADIDFVSGATQTCEGYQLSLQSALDQAA